MITITSRCNRCKKEHRMLANAKDVDAYRNGAHVQDAFPYLSADQRGLLISGICGKCFDEIFTHDEEDEE